MAVHRPCAHTHLPLLQATLKATDPTTERGRKARANQREAANAYWARLSAEQRQQRVADYKAGALTPERLQEVMQGYDAAAADDVLAAATAHLRTPEVLSAEEAAAIGTLAEAEPLCGSSLTVDQELLLLCPALYD